MIQPSGESSPDSLSPSNELANQRARAIRPTETFSAPHLSATGRPTFSRPDGEGVLGLAGKKLRRTAADTFQNESIPFWKRLVFDIPTQVAHSRNEKQMKQMSLFDPTNDQVFNRDTEEFMNVNDIAGQDFANTITPDLSNYLETKGFNFEFLNGMDFEKAQRNVRSFLIKDRISSSIKANSDSTFKNLSSGGLELVAGFVDPTLPIGLGAGTVGKRLGVAASKKLIAKESKGFLVSVTSKAADIIQRQGSISGSLINSEFTATHIATMIGVDTAFTSAAFDVVAQASEHDTYEYYFGDTDAPWFSASRNALSGGIGWLLGSGFARAFNVTNVHQKREAEIEIYSKRIDSSQASTPHMKRIRAVLEMDESGILDVDIKSGMSPADERLHMEGITTHVGLYKAVEGSSRVAQNKPAEFVLNLVKNVITGDPKRAIDYALSRFIKLDTEVNTATLQVAGLNKQIKSLSDERARIVTDSKKKVQTEVSSIDGRIAAVERELADFTSLDKTRDLKADLNADESLSGIQRDIRDLDSFDNELAQLKQQRDDLLKSKPDVSAHTAEIKRLKSDRDNIAILRKEALNEQASFKKTFDDDGITVDDIRRAGNRIQQIGNTAKRRRIRVQQVATFFKSNPTYDEAVKFLSSMDMHKGGSLKSRIGVHKLLVRAKAEVADLEASITKDLADKADPEAIVFKLERIKLLQSQEVLYMQQDALLNGSIDHATNTTFRNALKWKKRASELFDESRVATTSAARTAKLTQATSALQKSDTMFEKVKDGVAPKQTTIDPTTGELTGTGKFVQYIDDLKNTSASDLTPAQQAKWLKAHYLQNGGNISLYNKTAASKVLNNKFFNAMSSFFTSRNEMEQAAQKSDMFLGLVNLIDNLTSTSNMRDFGLGHVENLQSMVQRRNNLALRTILNPWGKMQQQFKKDPIALSRAEGRAMRIATGLPVDDATDLETDLAKGMRDMFDMFESDGVDSGYLKNFKENYLSVRFVNDVSPEQRELVKGAIKKHFDDTKHYKSGHALDSILAGTKLINKTKNAEGRETFTYGENLEFIPGTDFTVVDKVKVGRKKKGEAQEFKEVVRPMTVHEYLTVEKEGIRQKLDIWKVIRVKQADGSYKNAVDVYKEGYDGKAMDFELNEITANKLDNTGVSEGSQASLNPAQFRSSANAERSQQFPHQIFLTDEILDSGAVITNPHLMFTNYLQSTGFSILEQLQVNKLMDGNRRVSMDGLIEASLIDLSDRNGGIPPSVLDSLREMIKDNRDAVAGRAYRNQEVDMPLKAFAAVLKQLGSIPVNANIPLVMWGTEGIIPMLAKALTSSDIPHAMVSMLKGVKRSFDTEQREALGFILDQMVASQRRLLESGAFSDEVYFSYSARVAAPFKRVRTTYRGEGTARTFAGDTNTSSGRFANTAVAVSEALADTTRNFSTEIIQTNMLQGMYGSYALSMFHKRIPKLIRAAKEVREMEERLASKIAEGKKQGIDINIDPTAAGQEKLLRGIARHNGIPFGEFQIYMNEGLLEGRILQDMFRLKEMKGVEDFGDVASVYRAITFNEGRATSSERDSFERVMDMVRNEVNKDVTMPTVFDRPVHGKHPAVSLLSTFLSFSRGFRAGKMRDLANAGNAQASTAFMGFMVAEMFNQSLKQIVHKGASIDEVYNGFIEDPVTTASWALGNIPMAGPYQRLMTDFLRSAATGDRFTTDIAPVYSIVTQSLNNTNRFLRDPQDFESMKKASKNVPALNSPIGQMILNNLASDN